MADILLNDSGDIVIDAAGRARLTATIEEEATQRLRMRCRRFLGEWAYDTRLGINFFRDVLVKAPNLSVIRSVFAKEITSDVAVQQLVSLELTYEPSDRHLDIAVQVQLVDGELLATALRVYVLADGDNGVLVDEDGEQIAP